MSLDLQDDGQTTSANYNRKHGVDALPRTGYVRGSPIMELTSLPSTIERTRVLKKDKKKDKKVEKKVKKDGLLKRFNPGRLRENPDKPGKY